MMLQEESNENYNNLVELGQGTTGDEKETANCTSVASFYY